MTLQDQFGNIDIYVFDQLLRGRIAAGMRVFDAGCGGGRNLVYLLREGYDVCGNDADANAISQVKALAMSRALIRPLRRERPLANSSTRGPEKAPSCSGWPKSSMVTA